MNLLGSYLACHRGLASRLVTPTTHIVTLVIHIIDPFTKSRLTLNPVPYLTLYVRSENGTAGLPAQEPAGP